MYKCHIYGDSDGGSCEKIDILDSVGPGEDRERQLLGLDLGLSWIVNTFKDYYSSSNNWRGGRRPGAS